MAKRSLLLALFCCSLICMQMGCALPRLLWPQEDIAPSEVVSPDAVQRVLVASRSSEFKSALATRLKDGLQTDGVSIKVVGIEQLGEINAADYPVVVLIGSCIAWGLDQDVQAFLDRHTEHGNMIVVTTSGKGEWLPKKKDRDFDAVAAASKMVTVDSVANDVITRVRAKLHHQ